MIRFYWLPEGIERVDFIYPEGYKVTVVYIPNMFKNIMQRIFKVMRIRNK
jgi:hypothetical protein